MNVLVLNGSPKGEMSDTMRITRAFLSGMGCDAERVNVIDKKIAPCMGCFYCFEHSGCVQRDDMDELIERIVAADVVIWSTPLYCYAMPSHLKALIDRLLSLSNLTMTTDERGRTEHTMKREVATRFVLICGCGFPDFEHNFEGIDFMFSRMFGDYSPRIFCPEAPMFAVKEAEEITLPYLELVKRAGAEYAANDSISEELMRALREPMIPPEQYRAIVNGNA